jgi:hypothetical protein
MRGTVFPPSVVIHQQGWSRKLKTAPWMLWLVTDGSMTPPPWDLKLKRFASISLIWRSSRGRSPSACTPPLACC